MTATCPYLDLIKAMSALLIEPRDAAYLRWVVEAAERAHRTALQAAPAADEPSAAIIHGYEAHQCPAGLAQARSARWEDNSSEAAACYANGAGWFIPAHVDQPLLDPGDNGE